MAAATDVDSQTLVEVLLDAWALLDTFMMNDPTCKTVTDPHERVLAICRNHGMNMRQQWRDMRARLGEPVEES